MIPIQSGQMYLMTGSIDRLPGGVLLLVEQAFYAIAPGLAGCRIDEVASPAGTTLHRMVGVSWFPQPWISAWPSTTSPVRGQRNIKSRIKLDSRCGVIRHLIVPHDACKGQVARAAKLCTGRDGRDEHEHDERGEQYQPSLLLTPTIANAPIATSAVRSHDRMRRIVSLVWEYCLGCPGRG